MRRGIGHHPPPWRSSPYEAVTSHLLSLRDIDQLVLESWQSTLLPYMAHFAERKVEGWLRVNPVDDVNRAFTEPWIFADSHFPQKTTCSIGDIKSLARNTGSWIDKYTATIRDSQATLFLCEALDSTTPPATVLKALGFDFMLAHLLDGEMKTRSTRVPTQDSCNLVNVIDDSPDLTSTTTKRPDVPLARHYCPLRINSAAPPLNQLRTNCEDQTSPQVLGYTRLSVATSQDKPSTTRANDTEESALDRPALALVPILETFETSRDRCSVDSPTVDHTEGACVHSEDNSPQADDTDESIETPRDRYASHLGENSLDFGNVTGYVEPDGVDIDVDPSSFDLYPPPSSESSESLVGGQSPRTPRRISENLGTVPRSSTSECSPIQTASTPDITTELSEYNAYPSPSPDIPSLHARVSHQDSKPGFGNFTSLVQGSPKFPRTISRTVLASPRRIVVPPSVPDVSAAKPFVRRTRANTRHLRLAIQEMDIEDEIENRRAASTNPAMSDQLHDYHSLVHQARVRNGGQISASQRDRLKSTRLF